MEFVVVVVAVSVAGSLAWCAVIGFGAFKLTSTLRKPLDAQIKDTERMLANHGTASRLASHAEAINRPHRLHTQYSQPQGVDGRHYEGRINELQDIAAQAGVDSRSPHAR